MREIEQARRAAIAIVAAALTVQLGGVLVGRVFYFEDIAAYFEPAWTFVQTSLRHGQLPTWALGAWSGQPLLGDPQLGVFYPPDILLLLVMAPVRAYAFAVVLHTAWAAAGAMVLCRALGRSWPAAATAALSLSLSAYFVLEARHVMFLVSAAWVPWLLYAIMRGRVVGIAVCAAMALLGGGWSMLVFALPPVLVFAIVHTRRWPALLLGALLGVGLAAIQLLPALAHAALSPRALPLADSFSHSYAWPSWAYAKTLLFPLAYGDDARGTYSGAPDQWELCGYGAGVVASLLALWSLRTREYLLYACVIVLALIIARGDADALLRHIPLVDRTRCPARALFMVTLVVPLLCASGVDSLPSRLRWLAPLAVALELTITFRAENPTTRTLPIAPAVLAGVPHAPSDGRTIFDVHLGQQFHNGGLRWNIESASGYSSLPLWRYLHLQWIANHHGVYPAALAHDLTAQGLWTLDSPIVDLLNVRWLIAPHDQPPTGTGWVLEQSADGIDRWRNDEALPRGFVTHDVERVDDDAAALARLGVATHAIVAQPIVVSGNGIDAAQMTSREGSTIRFAVTAHGAGLFVLSEPWTPAWRAQVDGVTVPVLRVDYALTGVAIGDGAHQVIFSQEDRSLRIGSILSLLSFIGLGLALGLGLVRRRRA